MATVPGSSPTVPGSRPEETGLLTPHERTCNRVQHSPAVPHSAASAGERSFFRVPNCGLVGQRMRSLCEVTPEQGQTERLILLHEERDAIATSLMNRSTAVATPGESVCAAHRQLHSTLTMSGDKSFATFPLHPRMDVIAACTPAARSLSCACPYAADPPPARVRAGQSSERRQCHLGQRHRSRPAGRAAVLL